MLQQPLYALLIGIDRYASPTVPDLGGCVNDVEAMGALLQTTFAVAADHIAILRNEQATLAGVQAAFHRHLIEMVRNHLQQAQFAGQAPAVLFHFSGHGSQAPDPIRRKASGLDETLVCHDSRLPGIYDLKDWELGEMIDELAQYTENITVILDCCHSGSGTRPGKQPVKPVVNVRGCDADRRTQPHSLAQDAPRSFPVVTATPAVATASGVVGSANHVLLAACLNKEKAYEYVPPSLPADVDDVDETKPNVVRRRHGALTYFLLQSLTALDPKHLPTYYELYAQLKPQIADRFPQTVQCEGDWGRVLFGTARPNRDLWLMVVERQIDTYVINGGAVHGIRVGSRFYAYAPGVRTLDSAGAELGVLEAVQVGVAQSDCRLVEGDEVPRQARLAPELATLISQRRTVAIAIPYAQIAGTLRERLAQNDMAPLVALLPAPSAEADLRLILNGRDFVIQSAGGNQLGPVYPMHELNPRRRPFTPADFEPIAAALKRIVRVQEIAALENLGSPLADAVTVVLQQVMTDRVTGAQQIVPLPETEGGTPLLPSGEPFVVEVTNQYLEALYIGVLLISAAWTVDQLYPNLHGTHVLLASGNTLRIGMEEGRTQPLVLTLHEASASPQTETGATVTLLVIATKEETDFTSLLQREEALAERVRLQLQNTKRDFRFVPEVDPADEWLIKRLPVQVIPSPHSVASQ
ncbi:MAG: caspase family protein [Caldilineaceae bacterium]|nr:caspase family protein [Caldilineaceae bacterium]